MYELGSLHINFINDVNGSLYMFMRYDHLVCIGFIEVPSNTNYNYRHVIVSLAHFLPSVNRVKFKMTISPGKPSNDLLRCVMIALSVNLNFS